MATISEIIQARTEAGQAYASAVAALRAAYIELWAHDIAINNGNLPTPSDVNHRTFVRNLSLAHPSPLEHPVFATNGLFNWEDEAKAKASQIINSYAG
ncbi:hypothetical protein [Sinorhizobium americanum]|uniref:Uncharacterized protein n=1 Tax=Sinorhizobium americanum TaxID=194963 RepID=A0A4R2BR37_9HYPH|nr:hypothetical protein [Sinorhizobium americanum]TCN30137.1 hypothetical protein EV184_1083 [Sinorhizobium americanum]